MRVVILIRHDTNEYVIIVIMILMNKKNNDYYTVNNSILSKNNTIINDEPSVNNKLGKVSKVIEIMMTILVVVAWLVITGIMLYMHAHATIVSTANTTTCAMM